MDQSSSIAEWGAWHKNLFGFPDSFAPSIGAWCSEFAVTGYSAAELIGATRVVAALPSEQAPKYPGDHYAALIRALQAERARVRLADASAETRRVASGDDRGVCELCGNTKWVIVPHLKFLEEWNDAARFVTFTVACRCFLGRAMIAEWNVKHAKRPMTIEEYERQLPSWRDYIAQEREIRAARVKTSGVMSAPVDLSKSLANKFRLPKDCRQGVK